MKTYQLAPAFFEQMQRRSLLLFAGIFIPILVGALVLSASVSSITAILFIAAVVLPLVIGVALAQGRQTWGSYRLLLDENTIARVQDPMPEVKLSRQAVSRIVEVQNDGLTIEATSKNIVICVPATVEHYAEVRT